MATSALRSIAPPPSKSVEAKAELARRAQQKPVPASPTATPPPAPTATPTATPTAMPTAMPKAPVTLAALRVPKDDSKKAMLVPAKIRQTVSRRDKDGRIVSTDTVVLEWKSVNV